MPEVEGLFDVLEIALPAPDAGDLLNRVRQRVAHRLLVEARHRCGGGRGADRRADAFGAAMRGPHVIGAEREQPSTAEVVAEHDRVDQLESGGMTALPHRQRGWHDGATRMGLGDRLEIVGLIGMPEHAVDERRVDGRRPQIGRQDRRFRRASLRSGERDRHLAGLQPRARDHRRDRVEDAVPRLADDLWRQLLLTRGRHVARDAAGEIGTSSSGALRVRGDSISADWNRCSGRKSPRVLQQPPTGKTSSHGVGASRFSSSNQFSTILSSLF